MGTLHIRDGNLFQDTPAGSILAHTCNAQGVWGAGIALQFKKAHPRAYVEYRDECLNNKPHHLMGKALLVNKDTSSPVACLMVSRDYGVSKDAPGEILQNTRLAILDLIRKAQAHFGTTPVQVFSPQINAGLFSVPWHETLGMLREVVGPVPQFRWTVFIARAHGGKS